MTNVPSGTADPHQFNGPEGLLVEINRPRREGPGKALLCDNRRESVLPLSLEWLLVD
jgi:hypothetical protein